MLILLEEKPSTWFIVCQTLLVTIVKNVRIQRSRRWTKEASFSACEFTWWAKHVSKLLAMVLCCWVQDDPWKGGHKPVCQATAISPAPAPVLCCAATWPAALLILLGRITHRVVAATVKSIDVSWRKGSPAVISRQSKASQAKERDSAAAYVGRRQQQQQQCWTEPDRQLPNCRGASRACQCYWECRSQVPKAASTLGQCPIIGHPRPLLWER